MSLQVVVEKGARGASAVETRHQRERQWYRRDAEQTWELDRELEEVRVERGTGAGAKR